MTRFVVALHGWPAGYEVGFEAASRAPARAALSIDDRAWNRRARSAPRRAAAAGRAG